MAIAGIGYTSYFYNMPNVKPSGSSAMPSQPLSAGSPQTMSPGYSPAVAGQPSAQQGTLPAIYMTQNEFGRGVLYQNTDGDSAEISMPGSGLLDSLKPEGECQTCANRKYVDGSDDPSVSYQTPTKISSSNAGAAVAAHEQEHVRNEKADAQREGRQIVSQTVTLEYDTCPECGKVYVAGGTTRTMSKGTKELPEFAKPNENDKSTEE